MVCMNDKAVVPVGDPGMPLSTGVRPHNRVLAPTEGPELVAIIFLRKFSARHPAEALHARAPNVFRHGPCAQ